MTVSQIPKGGSGCTYLDAEFQEACQCLVKQGQGQRCIDALARSCVLGDGHVHGQGAREIG